MLKWKIEVRTDEGRMQIKHDGVDPDGQPVPESAIAEQFHKLLPMFTTMIDRQGQKSSGAK